MLATIIIPMYNAEKSINKTLDSIVAQTYCFIQLIIVNDGSTDNSLNICESYRSKIKFIEIYTTENKGVSHARNEGLTHAKGDYIFFVDSDDILLPNYIEVMMGAGEEDYIRSGNQFLSLEGKKKVNILNNNVITVKEHRKRFTHFYSKIPTFVVWGCRYKKSIIFQNKIKFRENIHNGEDVIFNIDYLKNSQTIKTISYVGYIYCESVTSSVGKFWPERLEWVKEMNKAQIAYGAESVGINVIKLYGWEEVLLHYKKHSKYGKDKKIRKDAKYMLKRTMHDIYFRDGINDIIEYGTIDMKLQAICLKYYIWCFYPILLKFIIKLHKIKRN